MDWVKLTAESMATQEDWETVCEIAEPDEDGSVYLTSYTDKVSVDELLKRFVLATRARKTSGWTARAYIIILDTTTGKYLTRETGRGYQEFLTVAEAIEYLKNNHI